MYRETQSIQSIIHNKLSAHRHPFSKGFLQVIDMLLRSCIAWSEQRCVYLFILVLLVLKHFLWRVALVILNDYDAAMIPNSESMLCLLLVIV
jgi:hypothetical protein